MESLEAYANMIDAGDPNDVFVIATGTAPHTDSVDMDLLIKFMKSQPTKTFYVFLFDDRWSEVPHVMTNQITEYLGNLPFVGEGESVDEKRTRQESVRKFKSLQAFGESCPVQEGTIWSTLKRASLKFPELYIYNCAWWKSEIHQNAYYENMCELANIFADHPNAFILTNDRHDYNVFSLLEPVTRVNGIHLYKTPNPGKFKSKEQIDAVERLLRKGGRKRTRRGLKKRRASRRWKRQS
jgi:hypothetical protein